MNSKALISLPYFSIVIATYNRGELITRALNSLLNQSEKDWEAIVVDDGSSDNSYELIAPYLEKDKRIKYIIKEHTGEANTKNKGIYSSQGQYITFLDSDDEYHPNHLKLRKKALQENTSIKFLYGGLEIIGNQYVPNRFKKEEQIHLSDCVAGGTFVVERNTMLHLKGFSELKELALGNDADLFERAKAANISILKVSSPSYIYHHENMDSITNSWKEDV